MRRLLLFFVVAFIAALAARELPFFYRSLRCGVPVSADLYIAYCNSEKAQPFGDYEIGAFAYDLEPSSIRHAKAADVLILGNSHSQVAMSTPEVSRFFREINASHFLLGFGFYSRSAVALHLVETHQLRPKVIIVNADSFFSPGPQEKEGEVLQGRFSTRLEYVERMIFDRVHAPFCKLMPLLCQPPYRTIFRSRVTGEWIYKDTLWWSQYTQPLVETANVGDDGSVETARDFIRRFAFDPQCVIVTAIPSSFKDSAGMARRVASAIQSPIFLPKFEKLNSYDGDHLTLEDSGRWSSAFLELSRSTIKKCLARPKRR